MILRLAAGERLGTYFTPLVRQMDSLGRFILSGWDGKSKLLIDAGAVNALRAGKSLLAVGVQAVQGDFDAGETVAICAPNGVELARGLPNYAAREVQKLLGRHSDDIERVLGYFAGGEVVHRDYLVLLDGN
jgi:glutamate 5-kinase